MLLSWQLTYKKHLQMLTYLTCETRHIFWLQKETQQVHKAFASPNSPHSLIQHFATLTPCTYCHRAIFPASKMPALNNICVLTFVTAASCAPLKSPILPLPSCEWLSDPLKTRAQKDGALCTRAICWSHYIEHKMPKAGLTPHVSVRFLLVAAGHWKPLPKLLSIDNTF